MNLGKDCAYIITKKNHNIIANLELIIVQVTMFYVTGIEKQNENDIIVFIPKVFCNIDLFVWENRYRLVKEGKALAFWIWMDIFIMGTVSITSGKKFKLFTY